jgi:type I site-specific restriction endonuclease
MDFANLRARLFARRKSQAESVETAYRELVQAAANEDSMPAVDDIERIIESAGKSLDDYERDVQLFRRRQQWSAQIPLEPALRKELNDLESQMRASSEVLFKAREKCLREQDAIRASIQRCQSKLSAIAHVRVFLSDSSPHSRTQTELARSLNPARERLEEIERELREAYAARDARGAQALKGKGDDPDVKTAVTQPSGRSPARIAQLEKEQAVLRGRLSNGQKEQARLTELQVAP